MKEAVCGNISSKGTVSVCLCVCEVRILFQLTHISTRVFHLTFFFNFIFITHSNPPILRGMRQISLLFIVTNGLIYVWYVTVRGYFEFKFCGDWIGSRKNCDGVNWIFILKYIIWNGINLIFYVNYIFVKKRKEK